MPFHGVSQRPTSHKSSQAFIYADMLRNTGVNVTTNFGNITDYNQYDEVFVYHGNDFTGSLNIFGGLQAAKADLMVSLSNYKGKVTSLAIPFPSYHSMISDRIQAANKNETTINQSWLSIDLEGLASIQSRAQTVIDPLITNKLVIGDSHAISLYRPQWMMNSVPFTTLNGALNRGLNSYIHHKVDYLDVYFGNIDIRHHLCRINGEPSMNAKELALRYVEAVELLDIPYLQIYEPLPIENESRKIPKTGHYDGLPFSGAWGLRNEVRDVFIHTIKSNVRNARFVEWTGNLINDKGELDFACMEKPQSVHLSRASYPWWRG
jgi:hypothetical protein